MKAYKSLVKYALDCGHSVSVYSDGICDLSNSSSYRDIVANVEAVEECELIIRDAEKHRIGWALVVPFGCEDEETVADYSDNAFMHAWESAAFA